MPKKENLRAKVDFLNIVFDTAKLEEVIYMLNIPRNWFGVRQGTVAYKDYQNLYQFGEIKVFSDSPKTEENPLGLGAYLALGGKGCTELEQFVGNYGLFFQRLIKELGKNSFHVTRIDLAIDDTNNTPFFTIKQLIEKCDREEYISVCKKHKEVRSVDGKNIARTLYIGVGKSQISFRFYDKDMERINKGKKLPEGIKSWKRTEIQLRDQKAHEFALFLRGQSLEETICGLLKESLRFVVRDKDQKNKSRWKTCQFWERFLGNVKPVKLQIPKEDSALADTQDWFKYGGGASFLKIILLLQENDALGGLEDIDKLLKEASLSPELANKVVSHLQNINRGDLIPYIYAHTRKLDN